MKFKELIVPLLKSINEGVDSYYEISLKGEALEMFKERIKECDEFKNVDDIVIMDSTFDEKLGSTCCYKLKDGMELKNTVYLYSIFLSPEVYDKESFYKHVKNNASLNQLYDSSTFKLSYDLLINVSLEDIQDDNVLKTGARQKIHSLLDDILDNPNEYKVKGTKEVIVRGILNQ